MTEGLPETAGATTREVEKRVGAGWGQGKIGMRPPRLRAVARIRAMVEVWRPVRWAQLGPRGSGRLARSSFSTLDSARAATALRCLARVRAGPGAPAWYFSGSQSPPLRSSAPAGRRPGSLHLLPLRCGAHPGTGRRGAHWPRESRQLGVRPLSRGDEAGWFRMPRGTCEKSKNLKQQWTTPPPPHAGQHTHTRPRSRGKRGPGPVQAPRRCPPRF